MDKLEKFNEKLLLEKQEFYSNLIMEDITDADYIYAKKVCKDFEINDLYLESDTLSLADVFEKFRKMCLKVYQLVPAKFLSGPGLAWEAALKKAEIELELLTDIDMLLIVEKGTRGGTCNSINRYAKDNNKLMKDYDKNKKSSYLKYWGVNNLNNWEMSKELPVNGFERVEHISEFDKCFIKNYNEESEAGYFLVFLFIF